MVADGLRWNVRSVNRGFDSIQADAYRYGKPGKTKHPTQKPFECVDPMIFASSDLGDWILDPFMGSGTTLVAAKQLGRKAVGIEIEERYCEIAARRLDQKVLPFPKEPAVTETQAEMFAEDAI